MIRNLKKRVGIGATCLGLFAFAAAARAEDSFFFDNMKYLGTVKGLRDGRLWAAVPAGERLYDLSKVRDIVLDGRTKFNEAEATRATDAKKSAALYRDAIREFNDPALKLLAQYRAIQPTESDGRWTEAITYFLDVYAAAPNDAMWAARPTRLPAAGSSMLRESFDRIAAALPRFNSDDARRNLKLLQLDLLTRAGDTAAAQRLARELETGIVETPPATPPPQAGPPTNPLGAAVQSLEAMVTSGDAAGAVKRSQELLAGPLTEDQCVKVLQIQARALEQQQQFDLATAAILGIVARSPSHSAAPAALFQAAQWQKRQNHDASAQVLLDEILRSYPDSREAVLAKTP